MLQYTRGLASVWFSLAQILPFFNSLPISTRAPNPPPPSLDQYQLCDPCRVDDTAFMLCAYCCPFHPFEPIDFFDLCAMPLFALSGNLHEAKINFELALGLNANYEKAKSWQRKVSYFARCSPPLLYHAFLGARNRREKHVGSTLGFSSSK